MIDVKRSVLLSGVDRIATLAVTLLATALIARLLTPGEIGVFVLGSAVVMLTESLREFGASVYLIQAREITREGARTTFTAMFGISVVLAIGLVVAAGPVSQFYEEPRLIGMLRVAALGLLFGAFVSPPLALLRREGRFGAVALVNFAAVVTNLAVAVGLILGGFGYISLAWASVASVLAMAIVLIVIRRDFDLYRPCLAEWRQLLAFGGTSSGTVVLNMLSQMLPPLVLGRVLGIGPVGLYSRAVFVCQLPERVLFTPFTPVLLSAFASRARAGEDLLPHYLYGAGLLAALQWPALIFVALMADPIVRVLLGPQWQDAVPLVRLIACGSLATFAAPLSYPVLVAVGRIRDTLTGTLISFPVSVTVIGAASFFGLQAVAASFLILAPFQMIVVWMLIRRTLPFRWCDLAAATAPSGGVALASAVAPALTIAIAGPAPSLPVAVLAGIGAAAGWLLALRAVRHPLLADLSGLMESALAPLRTVRRSRPAA